MTFEKLTTLNGQVAVVIGGCGQVGFATAKRLAELGARTVIVTHRDMSRAKHYVDLLPNQNLGHFALQASVTDTASLKSAVKEIQSRAGQCNILINTAGTLTPVPPTNLHELSDELFDQMVSTNLTGVYATIREFSALMKTTGDALIINVSSQSAQRASNSCVAYAASKAGLDLMTRTLGKALAPNIRVIGIAPGYLEHATSGVTRIESNENLIKGSPMGRLTTGEDVANAVEAFATHIRFATGITLLLDGGRLL
jgi:NAD(P)-dependent dehydrogenase (short-subunit alcohol dehydrogenase family)